MVHHVFSVNALQVSCFLDGRVADFQIIAVKFLPLGKMKPIYWSITRSMICMDGRCTRRIQISGRRSHSSLCLPYPKGGPSCEAPLSKHILFQQAKSIQRQFTPEKESTIQNNTANTYNRKPLWNKNTAINTRG